MTKRTQPQHVPGAAVAAAPGPPKQDLEALDIAQAQVTRVYDRIAAGYDVFESPMDWFGGTRRRQRVLSRAHGRVLEVGIGTGRNLAHYPPAVQLTGIDVSSRMLRRARSRSERLGAAVEFELADVQRLPYADATFDTVTATCVFCSVADPIRGLAEVRRVVRPDGMVLLLEHVRPAGRLLGWLADQVTPLIRRLVGPEINRRTEENVVAAGLAISDLRRHGVWREITARPSQPEAPLETVVGSGMRSRVARRRGYGFRNRTTRTDLMPTSRQRGWSRTERRHG